MGQAYSALAPAVVTLEVPDGWPVSYYLATIPPYTSTAYSAWSYPGVSSFAYPTTVFTAGSAYGVVWPPGWPQEIQDPTPANVTLVVDVTATLSVGASLATTADLKYSGTDDDLLRYHLIEVVAFIGTTRVQLKKNSGDSYTDAITFKATNYTGSKWGFSASIYLDVDAGDVGSTVTVTGRVVTVQELTSGSDTTVVIAAIVPSVERGYVYGGDLLNQDCDEFTVGSNSWANKTNMPLPYRSSLAASSIGAKSYIYGGLGGSYSADCDEYAPFGDSWASKSDMPSPARRSLSASTIGTSGYLYAGLQAGNIRIADCDQFTPDSNSWASKTDVPTSRSRMAASTIGSKGYVYAGIEAVVIVDCDEYNPSGDSWGSKTNVPAPARRQHAGSTIGSSGYIYDGTTGALIADCDEFTPASNSWANKTDAPTVKNLMAASTIGSKGYVYAGTITSGSRVQDCDEFAAGLNSWASKTNMPTPARTDLAASTISS